jgi:hypothetical protein
MKLRIAAFAAVALAAITLLAGCNKGASNTSSTNSNSTSNAGTTSSPTAKPTATTTTSSGADTPTDAFKAYYNAIKNKDSETVKALFSKSTLKSLEDKAKAMNKSADDIFKDGLESASKEIPAALPETRNEKIDGDHATLEVKDEKKDSWDTINFIKEDGQWKISFSGADSAHD